MKSSKAKGNLPVNKMDESPRVLTAVYKNTG